MCVCVCACVLDREGSRVVSSRAVVVVLGDSAFSGMTSSGRIWRKVPESDARSVDECL